MPFYSPLRTGLVHGEENSISERSYVMQLSRSCCGIGRVIQFATYPEAVACFLAHSFTACWLPSAL